MAAKGYFGFAVDNTIGATPQPNGWMDNWVDFFRERRLRHQLQLASGWLCCPCAGTLVAWLLGMLLLSPGMFCAAT